ncbi:phenylalanine ammonia-lyase, partial [Phakopsora pachyrhizi]
SSPTKASDRVQVQMTKSEETLENINSSLEFMLARTGKSTYGVTTGFGAAATTRTDRVKELQVSIVEHLLAGATGFEIDESNQQIVPSPDLNIQSITQPIGPMVMSESIVRGAILIRLNSLSRGHSAVRMEVLDDLINLLNRFITPLVPLRGTISASGDLSPLAYVAGTLCAHPDVIVIDRSLSPPRLLKCEESLKRHGIEPLTLGPKEGLAICNGTAYSASAACIAIYQAHVLALLSEVVTAMTVEALQGQIGAFHPFIHQVARPHPGQVEVAQTIFGLLKNSKMIDPQEPLIEKDLELERLSQMLRQDRYPLRTSPQWLGPQIEELISIHRTVTQELNSTTDNPLSDSHNGILHHGGNFQASSISNSMEKLRLSIAMIGKMSFSQMTELNNSWMNKGLPSCLNGSEPSTNYHTKGLDTCSAAYCSELQYLANPVTTHVQSAEGHNQAINSLAFLSGRKTLEAIDVLKLLMASHIYCLCQALDLRVIENRFREALETLIYENLVSVFQDYTDQDRNINFKLLAMQVLDTFWRKREHNSSLDSKDRIIDGFEASISPIVQAFGSCSETLTIDRIKSFLDKINQTSLLTWKSINEAESIDLIEENTLKMLGGSKRLYKFIRSDLGIKFRRGDVHEGRMGKTIGNAVNRIAKSMEIGGEIEKVLIRTLEDLS